MNKCNNRSHIVWSVLIIYFLIMTPFFAGCGSSGGGGDNASQNTNNDNSSPNDTIPQDINSALDYQDEATYEMFESLDVLKDYDQNIVSLLMDKKYEEIEIQYKDVYPALLVDILTSLEKLWGSHKYIDQLNDVTQTLNYRLPGEDFDRPDTTVAGCALTIATFAAFVIAAVSFIVCAEEAGYRDKFDTEITPDEEFEFVVRLADLKMRTSKTLMTIEEAIFEAEQDLAELKSVSTVERVNAVIRATQRGIKAMDVAAKYEFDQILSSTLERVGDVSKTVSRILGIKGKGDDAKTFTETVHALLTPENLNVYDFEKLSDICKSPIPGLEDIMDEVNLGNNIKVKNTSQAVSNSGSNDQSSIYLCRTENGECTNLPDGKWNVTVFAPGRAPETIENLIVSADDSELSIEAEFMSLDDIKGSSMDSDGDGHYPLDACNAYPADDCDDNDHNRYPGNVEVCDGKDNDCNSQIDDGLSTDADGDGHYSTDSCATPNDDCDDSNANKYPGNTEIPDDGIDQDCDGSDQTIPPVVGACCGALGVCYETGQALCETAGDTYQGTGTACSPDLCPKPKEYVVYTIDNATCFDSTIITVGERSKFNEEELVCTYWYYGENTCTVVASKSEVQSGFDSGTDAYAWIESQKGEWMMNRWCPGNGYYKISGLSNYYMIF